jgi:hypothetical protein
LTIVTTAAATGVVTTLPRTAPSPSLTGEVSSGTLGLGELNDFDLRRKGEEALRGSDDAGRQ